jgi:hypothetical protein
VGLPVNLLRVPGAVNCSDLVLMGPTGVNYLGPSLILRQRGALRPGIHTMMVRILLLTFVSAWLPASFSAPVALGQSIPSPYRFIENRHEAGLVGGFASQGTGRFGFGPAPGPSLGLRYGIRLGGPFSLDGVASYIHTTRDVVDPSRAEGGRVVGEVDAGIATLDVRLRFSLTGDRTWHGVSPFVFMGAGGAFDVKGESEVEAELLEPENDRFRFRPTFTGVMGSGVGWYPTDRLMLRADVSLLMWRLRTPPGFRAPERNIEGAPEREWVSGPSFTLGAAIRF